MIFYHGTTDFFNLKEGNYLLPAIQTGILREEWRKNNTDKVFFTASLLSATKFAKKAAAKYGGDPIIYTIEPFYPYYYKNITNEYYTHKARITGTYNK